MRRAFVVGIAGGAALSAWSVATMLWPVSYRTWDIGRGLFYVAFLLALIAVAAITARVRESVAGTFASVAAASLVGAVITVGTYAISTGFFAHRIVQLPEYLRDYTHHGYTSPQVYLATNYADLLGLQVFSWTIAVAAQVVVAGTAGWYMRRVQWLR